MKDDDWPVLPGERRVRFGCGVLAGIALGIYAVTRMSRVAGGTVLAIAGFAVVAGFASALFGDRFWRLFRWW